MATLLVRLVGPMQSWGSRSRFDWRDTERETTKSGVLGLCAAALGRRRQDPIEDLASLRFGVRVDREGTLREEYQTAMGVIKADGTLPPSSRPNHPKFTVVSHRFYLADAAFLVGLEGPRETLTEIEKALRRPAFSLYLGRRGYVPSEPVFFPGGGLVEEGLEEALAGWPPLMENLPESVRYALEVSPGFSAGARGLVREVWDQPLGPFSERRFGPRLVWVVNFPRGEVPRVPEQTHS